MDRRRGVKKNVHETPFLTEPPWRGDSAEGRKPGARVLNHLREFEVHCGHIVAALARMHKITENSGHADAAELRAGKSAPLETVNHRGRNPRLLSSDAGTDLTRRQRKDDRLLERELYEPLKEYLKELGQYQLVENRA